MTYDPFAGVTLDGEEEPDSGRPTFDGRSPTQKGRPEFTGVTEKKKGTVVPAISDEQYGGAINPTWTNPNTPLASKQVAPSNAVDPSWFKLPASTIEGRQIPSVMDYSPQIAQVFRTWETFRLAGTRGRLGPLNRSLVDALMTPEMFSYIVDFEEMARGEMSSVEYASMFGTLDDFTEALYHEVKNTDGWKASTAAALKQQNASAFISEIEPTVTPEMKDVFVSILGSVPGDEIKDPGKVVRNQTQSSMLGPFAGAIEFASDIGRGMNIFSGGSDPQNSREELAADAYIRWQANPPSTPQEQKQFMVWFYMQAQQKSDEAQGRRSHIALLTRPLDAPRQLMSGGVNRVFNSIVYPNAEINHSHLSPGKNFALALGADPSADPGSGFLNNPVFNAVAWSVDKSVNLVPIVGAINAARGLGLLEGDQIDMPFISPFLDGMQQMNTFESVSGTTDFVANIALDPWTYAAGAGFGMKAAKTVPRAANITKAQQFFRAITPFAGPNLTGVRWGMTARVTHAFMSRTPSEMIDVARNAPRAKSIIATMAKVSSVEEAQRLIPALADNAATPLLVDAAKRGDEDFFWAVLEASMSGMNEKGNPRAYDTLRGMVNDATPNLHRSAQEALDSGKAGIRDMNAIAGGGDDFLEVATSDVHRVIPDPEAYPGDLKTRDLMIRYSEGFAPHGTKVSEDVLADGSVLEVRRYKDGFYAYIDGKGVGGLDLRPRGQSSIGIDDAARVHRTQGGDKIMSRVIDAAQEAGMEPLRHLAEAETGGGLSQYAARFINSEAERLGVPIMSTPLSEGGTVLRRSVGQGDGRTRTIINHTLGWNEGNVLDKPVMNWLGEQGHTDLALKLSLSESYGGTGVLDAILTKADWDILQKFVDDVGDVDALRAGDAMIVRSSSKGKLLTGADLADDITRAPVDQLLSDDLARVAGGRFMGQVLDGKHREVVLINRMPTVSRAAVNKAKIARATGISGNTRAAQFARRFAAGMVIGNVTSVNPDDIRGGAIDLRKAMKLMGTNQKVIDDIMEQWWRTAGVKAGEEIRHELINTAFQAMGNDINHPHMTYGFMDWTTKHGQQSFVKNSMGDEIGRARTADGAEKIVPIIPEHMQSTVPLPDLMQLRRMLGRSRNAKRIPQRIVAGFGKTNKNRTALAEAYKERMLSTPMGRKHFLELGRNEAERMDNLMQMAYADVLGYAGRESGIGLVNKMTSAGAGVYQVFHSAFTIGQLAFRPFAWASRINLEEHARAWMMGLPSMIRQPVQYANAFWDKHMFQTVDKLVDRQRKAAVVSAEDYFGPTGRGLEATEEILPGWAAKQVAAGLDVEDRLLMQQIWTHDLGEALGAGHFVNLNSRGNLARRTVRRQERIKGVTERLEQRYGLDPREFDFAEDVPEMMNKVNMSLFAGELESSIKDVDFTSNLRSKDVGTYAAAYGKKLQQMTQGQVGQFTIARMIQRLKGGEVTKTPEVFTRTHAWSKVRNNVEDVARHRGLQFDSEADLARWYLDELIGDELLGSTLRPLWGDSPAEKLRILTELTSRKEMKVNANGKTFTIRLDASDYASGKDDIKAMFLAQKADGNFNFPTVAGMFHPLYANPGANTKNPFRRFTNMMLQTFGEDVSQQLHRRPSYLAERRRVKGIYERIGWDSADAEHLAHQKALEMVNYTFFNNQHTGATIKRMNKVIPFFSAWAEVMGTWAWKIPSQNYLPLGYARMIHNVDRMMQGVVKLGLVDIDEDTGQWYLNISDDLSSNNSVGAGLSKAMFQAVQTPITAIEHLTNLARLVTAAVDDDVDYTPADLSAWKKDNYQLAFGSPVAINSHGVMGVNQFQFGLSPPLSYATSEVMKRIPFAGDTTLIEANTLAGVYEQLPTDVTQAEFLTLNRDVIMDKIGKEQFYLLYSGNQELFDPEKVDLSGVALQVPKSSWADAVIDDLFFPFGKIDSPAGVIRSISPPVITHMFRGLGLYADEGSDLEGILSIITGPTEQYQIDGEITKQILHLEASEGLVSKAQRIATEIQTIRSKKGTPEEMAKSAAIGSPESTRLIELEEDLELLNAQILKRATDNATMALFTRNLMGFTAPATPRTFFEEQKVTAQWWSAKEMAEAASVRGSVDWADALKNVKIEDEEDLTRMLGLISKWMVDPSGGEAKVWFNEAYPNLAAWTQPTTFWGPAGIPPLSQDIDDFFHQVAQGLRAPYPPDVMMQRVARSSIDMQYEADLIRASGTNDPKEQGIWAITNWGEYQELRDTRRLGFKSLDVWDDELNGGAYLDWRDRNNDDPPSLFEKLEEEIFMLQDAADEIFGLTDLADAFSPQEQRAIEGRVNAALSNYMRVFKDIREEIEKDTVYRNPREEMIGRYFEEVVGPYYEAKQQVTAKLQDAETKADRSVIFEELRTLENEMFATEHKVDGLVVPNELERIWSTQSPEEQEVRVLQWVSRPSEWLSDFAISKIVERSPQASEYLPTTPEAKFLFLEATAAKQRIIDEASTRKGVVSRTRRSQALEKVDDELKNQLIRKGFTGQAQWIDAWPIERLMMTGLLPAPLTEVGQYYIGIKRNLSASDKGPTSQEGRGYFESLFQHLENDYYRAHPEALVAINKLGEEMFSESGRFAVYARLYGTFVGEFD